MFRALTTTLSGRLTRAAIVGALGVVLCCTATAQTAITGTVRDTTNAPVSAAQVTARNGQQTATAITDSDGRFRITRDFPTATLTIKARGFAAVDQQWSP